MLYEISRLQLASVAEQAGLKFTWSQKPEGRFSRDLAQIDLNEYVRRVS